MRTEQADDAIRTKPVNRCYICGSEGIVLYTGMEDRIFSAPGEWTLYSCSNGKCGLVWLNPMPIAEDIWMAYRDYFFTHGESVAVSGLIGRMRCLVRDAFLRARMGYAFKGMPIWQRGLWPLGFLHPGGVLGLENRGIYPPSPDSGNMLLEVGCGNGCFLRMLCDLGWQGEGMDVDEAAVVTARGKGLKVEHGELASLGKPDENYDLIYMSHVVEHLLDPLPTLSECWRILRPGGHLMVLTPNVGGLGHRLWKNAWFALDPPRHTYLYTPSALRSLATMANFHVAKVFTTARGTNHNINYTVPIARTGRAAWSPKLSRRAGGMVFQFAERCLIQLGWNVGDEIVLFAQKTSS